MKGRVASTGRDAFDRERTSGLPRELWGELLRHQQRKELTKTDLPFSPTSLETISQRLTAIKDAAEQTGFAKEMRGRLSRYLDHATLSLERWNAALHHHCPC